MRKVIYFKKSHNVVILNFSIAGTVVYYHSYILVLLAPALYFLLKVILSYLNPVSYLLLSLYSIPLPTSYLPLGS